MDWDAAYHRSLGLGKRPWRKDLDQRYMGVVNRYGQPLTEEAGRDGNGWYFHIGRGKDGPIEDVKFRIGKGGRLTGTVLEPCWAND